MWPARSVVDSLSSGYPAAPGLAPDWHKVGVKRLVVPKQRGNGDRHGEPMVGRPNVPRARPRRAVSTRRKHVQGHRHHVHQPSSLTPQEVRLNKFRDETQKQNSVLEKALKKIGTDRLILKQVKRGKNTYVEAFNKMCTSRPLLRQGTNYLEKPAPSAGGGAAALAVPKPPGREPVTTPQPVHANQSEKNIVSPFASFVLDEDVDLAEEGGKGEGRKTTWRRGGKAAGPTFFDGPWESQDAPPDAGDLSYARPRSAEKPQSVEADVPDKSAGHDEGAPRGRGVALVPTRALPEDPSMIVGHTLAEHKVDQAIEKRAHEWGQYCTRIFQQKLRSQTRGFDSKHGRLGREHARSKEWVLQYFQLGIKDLLEELLELKEASFVDPRKTLESIKRYDQRLEVRRTRLDALHTKLSHLTERYNVEVHLVRAKVMAMEGNLKAAVAEEQGAFDALFKTKEEHDEIQHQLRKHKEANAEKEERAMEQEQALKRLQFTLKRLRKKSDVVLDPKLILQVDAASHCWAKVRKLLDGVMHDLGCPFCFKPMRLPQTVEITALGGTVTMCSHCVVEKSALMSRKEKDMPQLDHHRAANIVAQFGDGEYEAKVLGAEALVEELESSVGIVRGAWGKVKRRMLVGGFPGGGEKKVVGEEKG